MLFAVTLITTAYSLYTMRTASLTIAGYEGGALANHDEAHTSKAQLQYLHSLRIMLHVGYQPSERL
jgi:hypothetical protein